MTSLPVISSSESTLVSPATSAWGYMRHELLYLSFALLEVALLTPIALVIMGWARYWPAGLVALWLLLLMLLPLNLIRLMSLIGFELKRQRRVMFFALLLAVFLGWRVMLYPIRGVLDFSWLGQLFGSLAEGGNLLWTRDLSLFLLTIFAWWRGMRLAGRTPEINAAGLRLRLGGLILAPLIIWFSTPYLDFNIVPFLMLFFLAGLTTVALVRAEQIEREQQGTASTLNARWFAIVFGAALLIVFVGGALAALISGDSLFIILGWFSPLWQALQFGAIVMGAVLLKLAAPVLNVFAAIIQLLSLFLASVFGRLSEGLRESGLLEDLAPAVTITPTETVGAVGTATGGKFLIAGLMLGLIVLISLALARAYQQATIAARQSARSFDQGDLPEEKPGPGRRLLERLGLIRQWRAAASVRRIYNQMCRAAAISGYPRFETETPYEYLATLADVWPDNPHDARLITEAFVRVRYGEAPETKEELDLIHQAWRRLEALEPNRRATGDESMPTLTKRE